MWLLPIIVTGLLLKQNISLITKVTNDQSIMSREFGLYDVDQVWHLIQDEGMTSVSRIYLYQTLIVYTGCMLCLTVFAGFIPRSVFGIMFGIPA